MLRIIFVFSCVSSFCFLPSFHRACDELPFLCGPEDRKKLLGVVPSIFGSWSLSLSLSRLLSIADQLHISDFFLDETLAARALSTDRQSSLTVDGGGGGTGGGLGGPLTNLRRANSSEIVGFEELKAIINMLETELGLLSTIDLVLNHTASNSPWLRDHPDSGYSPPDVHAHVCFSPSAWISLHGSASVEDGV